MLQSQFISILFIYLSDLYLSNIVYIYSQFNEEGSHGVILFLYSLIFSRSVIRLVGHALYSHLDTPWKKHAYFRI